MFLVQIRVLSLLIALLVTMVFLWNFTLIIFL